MASEIAKAYVQILPTTKGIADNISKGMGDEAEQAGKTAGGKFSGAFGGTVKAIGGIATAAAAAAVGATSAIVKSATANFAEFEQLEGGAKLMFGDAYDFVADKAADAYKKVQLSQNEYLEQVNGLATGLKTALGGDAQAAAELADKVVTAEADIVSATGASQEAVQNAFNGIMKSNYTMLDNLQLGITPTKAGMQEVIDKVNEWRVAQGKVGDLTIENLADCQEALVDYVEMQGMANYAQTEGATTIQGSLASTKAAWDNLLTGMVTGNEDIGNLVDNLVNSASGLWDNVEPVIMKSLDGVSSLITKIAPVVAEKLPELVTTIAPNLAQAAADVMTSFVTALGENSKALTSTALDIVTTLLNAIMSNFPMIVESSAQVIGEIATGIGNALPELIPTVIDVVISMVDTLINNVDLLIDGAIALIIGLAEGLVEATPRLIEKIPYIIERIVESLVFNAPKLLVAALQLILTLGNGLIEALPDLLLQVPIIINALVDGLLKGVEDIKNVGVDMVAGLWEGVKSQWSNLVSNVENLAKNLVGKFKSVFQIGSPSKLFEKEVGSWIPAGVAVGIMKNSNVVDESILSIKTSALNDMKGIQNSISDMPLHSESEKITAAGLYEAVKDGMENAKISLTIGDREFARKLKGMGVSFA